MLRICHATAYLVSSDPNSSYLDAQFDRPNNGAVVHRIFDTSCHRDCDLKRPKSNEKSEKSQYCRDSRIARH